MIVKDEDLVTTTDLKLPGDAKVICYYRDGKFSHADEETIFRKGDEVVILTHRRNLPELQARWRQKPEAKKSTDLVSTEKATGSEKPG